MTETPPAPLEHKYGRRDPIPNRPRLKLSSFLRSTTIPEHPATADYGQRISDWQMLGNDQYGDCVAVTWANSRYLTTTWLAGQPTYPDQDQVLSFYRTQNPDFPTQDEGMVIQLALEELHKNGGPDGVKAVAFAEVDITNLEELRAALALFGGIWYGVVVTQANEQQFDQNKPWDYVQRSQQLGGHAILGPGYDPDVRFVTWAEETEFTEAFIQHQLQEAWVVVWPEHLGDRTFLDGVDLNELAAAYRALTGQNLDVPTPEPEPTPQPAPTPEPTPQPTPEPTPEPTPDPGAAPFPGADPEVTDLVAQAASVAGVSPQEWLNRILRWHFGLDE